VSMLIPVLIISLLVMILTIKDFLVILVYLHLWWLY
jgi:hypothetical protein